MASKSRKEPLFRERKRSFRSKCVLKEKSKKERLTAKKLSVRRLKRKKPKGKKPNAKRLK